MGKYIDADHLRAEIEKVYKSEIQPWLSGVSPKSVIYEYVLPIIDSLQQEQTAMGEVSEKPMQEELEEELDRFIASGKPVTVDDYGTYKVSYHDFKKVARHFAEWQREQDEKEQADLFTIVALDAAQRTREQMLKVAVNGWLDEDNEPPYDLNVVCEEKVPFGKFKHGDKVKLIIIKEE